MTVGELKGRLMRYPDNWTVRVEVEISEGIYHSLETRELEGKAEWDEVLIVTDLEA
jgi:hypothetical protein